MEKGRGAALEQRKGSGWRKDCMCVLCVSGSACVGPATKKRYSTNVPK